MPYTFEEYFIKEREVYGTSRDDSLTSNETTVFGLNGNDSLYSTTSTNYNFLFGGGGNDVYTMATGSALTIFDSGGIDRVIAEDLEFNDVNTYVLTIEGKHIASFNNDSGSLLVVLSWLDSGSQIETIELGDMTLTSAQVSSVLSQRPNFLGDVSLSDQTLARALPFGASDARLSDYLSYVLNQENSNMSDAKFFSSNGHYYEAFSENVTWEMALSNAEGSSYRGLKGYLLTVTSPEENDFVWKQVVNQSDITGWGSFVGKQGYWLAASDRASEGQWVWESGPERGAIVATSNGPNDISSAIPGINFWVSNVYNGSSRSDYDFAGITVPDPDKVLPPGYSADSVWDDLPTDIADASYGVGNGYVVEYGGLPATYQVLPSKGSVDEGDTLTFEILTTNIEWGTSLNYSIGGVSASDLSSVSLSGSFVIQENGVDGRATVSIPIAADSVTEGSETLTFTVGGQSAAVTINDTSKSPATPTYTLSANSSSVREGSSAQFLLSTTNVAAGTSVPYAVSGVSAVDIVGGALMGAVSVGENGRSSISISIALDDLMEGEETLSLSIYETSASITIVDAESIPVPPRDSPNEMFQFIGTETLDFDYGTSSKLVPGFQFSHGATYSIWVYDNTSRLDITDLKDFTDETFKSLVFNDNAKAVLEGEYVAFQSDEGEVSVLKMDDPLRRLDGDLIDGVTYSAWAWLGDSVAPPEPEPPQTETHELDVIVDLLGQVLYLGNLTETVTTTSHTVEYAGIIFNWPEVDSFVTTVVRDNEFTEEFAKEISDAFPSVAGISYQTALTIIGNNGIQDVLLMVAGADGNYVG